MRKRKRIHVINYCIVVCVGWALYGIPFYKVFNLDAKECIEFSKEYFYYWVSRVIVKSIILSILMDYYYFQIKTTLKQQHHVLQNSRVYKRNAAILWTLRSLVIFFEVLVVVPSFLVPIEMKFVCVEFDKKDWQIFRDLCSAALPMLNNLVNCFVYAGYVKEFRRFLLNILCRRRNEKREREQPSNVW